ADRATDQARVDSLTHVVDDAGVFVAHHQWRLPREEALGRVDVGAADAGRVHRDQGLPWTGRRIGDVIDREPRTAAPGCDLHRTSPPRGEYRRWTRSRVAVRATSAPTCRSDRFDRRKYPANRRGWALAPRSQVVDGDAPRGRTNTVTEHRRTRWAALGLLGVAALLAPVPEAFGTTYRWIDRNGTVRYSDRPPQAYELP